MGKKAIIEISLVEESAQETNDDIANEIFKELSEGTTLIPWCRKVNKVIIVDA
jgi:hypothetical protein